MEKKVIHEPVLLKEVVEYLDIKSKGIYVDCTLGDGGYSSAIAKLLSGAGKLFSFDYDEDSISFVKEYYKDLLKKENWFLCRENFANVAKVLDKYLVDQIDGIVFDLGLSSRQLDSQERGFSFRFDSKVDMRMDQSLGVDANSLVKVAGQKQLTEIIARFGEERFAGRIARAIKEWVVENPEKDLTTMQLVDLIRRVVPASYRKGSNHPARRTFQALRIAVNDELNNLAVGVTSALSRLACNGRIVVVSYHSLEDGIVKRLFEQAVSSGRYKALINGILLPTEEEIKLNSRASSAKMRALVRTCS